MYTFANIANNCQFCLFSLQLFYHKQQQKSQWLHLLWDLCPQQFPQELLSMTQRVMLLYVQLSMTMTYLQHQGQETVGMVEQKSGSSICTTHLPVSCIRLYIHICRATFVKSRPITVVVTQLASHPGFPPTKTLGTRLSPLVHANTSLH